MSKPDKPAAARKIRRLSRDEARLWETVMNDVERLSDHRNVVLNGVDFDDATVDETLVTPQPSPPPPKMTAARPAAAPPPGGLPELAAGQVAGIDKRMAARLRRGQLPIEGRLDLHGLTQEEAHRALDAFLAASQAAGRRCILVITGKGLKQSGEVGVLRNAVPHWLNLPPNRGRVLAFAHATPKDGGAGALYVLLRRNR